MVFDPPVNTAQAGGTGYVPGGAALVSTSVNAASYVDKDLITAERTTTRYRPVASAAASLTAVTYFPAPRLAKRVAIRIAIIRGINAEPR
ncbi:hypothetical protein D3C77_556780 [compost metagenome]